MPRFEPPVLGCDPPWMASTNHSGGDPASISVSPPMQALPLRWLELVFQTVRHHLMLRLVWDISTEPWTFLDLPVRLIR